MPLIAETYILLLTRVLLTVLALVYLTFAVLMKRQISLMTRAVSMKDSSVISALGTIHLIFAVIVLVVILFSL